MRYFGHRHRDPEPQTARRMVGTHSLFVLATDDSWQAVLDLPGSRTLSAGRVRSADAEHVSR